MIKTSFLHSYFARAIAAIALLLCLQPGMAQAQDAESPLRLAFVNVAGSAGSSAYSSIESILLQSNQLVLMDESVFLSKAEEYQIDVKTLRQSSARQENVETFQELLLALDVEALLVQDVFGNGGKLQVVVIGPRGNELVDLRRDIRRGRVSDEQAIDVLREVFSVAVPEVREFRVEQEEKARLAAEEAAANRSQVELVEEPTILDQVMADRRAVHGSLETGYRLNVGALLGNRMMHLTQEVGDGIDHGTPLFGIAGELDARFMLFSNARGALGATLFGAYAPFKTAFEGTQLESSFMRMGAELYVAYALNSSFVLRGFGGFETLAIELGENTLYQGHKYTSARLGVGVEYSFGELGSLSLGGGILPLLSAEKIGGSFGDATGTLGFEGAASLKIEPVESFVIGADYTAQYYTLEFEAPVAPNTAAKTTDLMHMIMLSIGYRL